jgi:predicted nucleic acid-binding protein
MTGSTATAREMVDTNVLVYAVDVDAGDKHRRAEELVQQLIDRDALALSAQILNEFFAVATKPNKPPAPPDDRAAQYVKEYAGSSEVLPLNAAITLRALEAMPRHGLSFWDALIWAAAKENGVAVISTEDFQHGRDVEGVRIVNPFVGAA